MAQQNEKSSDLSSNIERATDELKTKFWKEDLSRVKDEIKSLEEELNICNKPYEDELATLESDYSKRINQARLSLLIVHKANTFNQRVNQAANQEENKTQKTP